MVMTLRPEAKHSLDLAYMYLVLKSNPLPNCGCATPPIVPQPDSRYTTHMRMKAMRQKQNIRTLITKLKQRFRMSRMKSKMKKPILILGLLEIYNKQVGFAL